MAGQSMLGGVPFHGQIPQPNNKASGYSNDVMMHRVGKVAEYAGAGFGLYSALRGAWETLRPVVQGLRALPGI